MSYWGICKNCSLFYNEVKLFSWPPSKIWPPLKYFSTSIFTFLLLMKSVTCIKSWVQAWGRAGPELLKTGDEFCCSTCRCVVVVGGLGLRHTVLLPLCTLWRRRGSRNSDGCCGGGAKSGHGKCRGHGCGWRGCRCNVWRGKMIKNS